MQGRNVLHPPHLSLMGSPPPACRAMGNALHHSNSSQTAPPWRVSSWGMHCTTITHPNGHPHGGCLSTAPPPSPGCSMGSRWQSRPPPCCQQWYAELPASHNGPEDI